MNSTLWINFAKDMNMVWHPFQFLYFTTQFLCNLIDDFSQVFIDTTNQNLATELRTKGQHYWQAYRTWRLLL